MKEQFKILMVDDRPENLMALEAVLASPDYLLVGVTSGEGALKCLLNDDFALILLDVQMPNLNGFDTAKIIRTRQKCQNIPIIFITAISQTEENVLEGYDSGAVDYIFKPFNPQILRAKVDAFLRMHHCQLKLVQQREMLKRQIAEMDNLNEQLTNTTLELCRNEILLESMVAERTQRISSILESIKDGFFAVDADYKFTYVSKAAEPILGWSRQELLGKTLFEVLSHNPVLTEQLVAVSTGESEEPVCFESACLLPERCYEVRVYPAKNGLSVYLNDITERKLIDKEMARLDRLNLIGEMAAGIAHEIRNPMTTVRGFLQYAKSGKAALSPANLDLMVEELDRANSIITEFLSLAKNKNTDKQLQNLGNIIESLLPLIRAEAILDGKTVVEDIGPLTDFPFDAKEIRQLILNLAMNGLEAMQTGGTMKLRAYEEAGEVVLVVEDQGSGIEPDILVKLGTPFFTTKDTGTGLGLAICFSIAARHQAIIDIKSSETGTAIYVRFKLASCQS
ncbi:response regulator [Sporomusa sphaeroides]|uniref:histidine kinase n=2 Tax=Sporomusa TaxID=2375 RepID=A0ABM9W8J2_9FIRM|nr:response regulator [Sporomusa sphaeroides]OLS55401.1 sporulation kinase A [Sporomusa sphaeroides DSM 2875]CVK21427.1 Sporulation kinase A [Sporomusa sphaeroides DSM 2875]SCM83495.1 Signal transduction histidine kinase, nitrogen specific, NtrB [uncultured Sporomusa sp.]